MLKIQILILLIVYNGGSIESWEDDLDEEEIRLLKEAGFIVEELK